MATDDVYRFTGNATWGNNQYMVSMAFQSRLPGDPVPADLTALADDVMGLFRPIQHNGINWPGWTMTQLWGSNMAIDQPNCRRTGGKGYAGVFTPPTAGAVAASEILPPQCALVTTLLTGFTGRSKRGRVYAFGFQETDQSAGTWGAAVVSGFQTRWATFLGKYGTAAVTGSFRFGIWSERTATGCAPGPDGKGHVFVGTPHPELAFQSVGSVTVRSTVFTQRRRVSGVGR